MLKEVCALIESAQSFVLTTHARPDGDAVGSVLGFAHYLRKKGKKATIINCDLTPFNMEWLPGAGDIQHWDGSLDQIRAIAEADVVAVMDANAKNRLGAMGKSVVDAPGVKLLIDHHTDPEGWFDLAYARESASSTGHLVYELIDADDPSLVDHAIAVTLYTAIVTDTGSFRFSNVTPDLHRLVGDLIERGGVEPSEIHSTIFDRKSPESLRLLSRVLNSLQMSHDGQISHTVISRAMLQETGASIEDTEGYVNWGLAIEGVRATMLFTETERGTKVSFRSQGSDHVHKWAQSLGGGGHPNASGAFVRKPLDETIQMVVKQAPRFLDLKAESAGEDELSAEDQAYLTMLQASPRNRG
ncbi:MAG: bifunctional oligoribonuclease/PAP phosphatase NrnA [Rhodothermales bacterium]|nr:bifunctional oligoribonuclease/PAP phosphatase NrnA [Rhodothermales bacterium]